MNQVHRKIKEMKWMEALCWCFPGQWWDSGVKDIVPLLFREKVTAGRRQVSPLACCPRPIPENQENVPSKHWILQPQAGSQLALFALPAPRLSTHPAARESQTPLPFLFLFSESFSESIFPTARKDTCSFHPLLGSQHLLLVN